MQTVPFLRPGIPDDDNRDYLPESLRQTDLVVNENGNNSQPYPERLIEFHAVLADGQEDTWYEYVPASYDPQRKTPLVLSMHGGLMSGWGQAVYTSWTLVADREGLIVVFPNASSRKVWTVEVPPEKRADVCTPNEQGAYLTMPPDDCADMHDVRFTLALMEMLKHKYNIDEQRIYMQGMSMGNLMTSQFARRYGNLLAGAAGSGMPSDPMLLFAPDGGVRNAGGPLDVWHSRLELDNVPPHYGADTQTVVWRNIQYWLKVNACSSLPKIRIVGDNNLARFSGGKGDVVLRDVKGRDHGQTFDDAELVWDYLFSGVRRMQDGTLQRTDTALPFQGDQCAIAIADGCSNAWVNQNIVPIGSAVFTWQKLKYHGLNGDAIVRATYLYAPVRFIAEVFHASLLQEGATAVLTLADGRTFQFARGGIGCVVDGRVESMLCEAVYRNGELCVPLAWFCQRAFDWHVSECDGVLYATDHHAVLSRNMARLLHELLTGQLDGSSGRV